MNLSSSAIARVRRWLDRIADVLRPGPVAARGAVWGALLVAVLLGAISGPVILFLGFGPVVDALAGAIAAGLIALLGALALRLVLAVLTFWPRSSLAVVVGGMLLIALLLGGGPEAPGLLVGIVLALAGALAGGAIATLRDRSSGPLRGVRRLVSICFLVLGAGLWIAFGVWAFMSGSDEHLIRVDLNDSVPQLEAPDPSERGPWKVLTLTYGSGRERHRPEFGDDVDIVTDSVDGTAFLPKLTGPLAPLRKWYWGFYRDALPVNGTVWYPEGDGPFPLVLFVHGNHNMGEFSDPGYEWICDLLASRGFIAVSVDENFLNGSWMPSPEGENDARGWLLLEHLKQWRRWTEAPGNPFFSKVDLDRIALVGHSRGGEAVTEAAAFNQLSNYPDDARTTFDYGFHIKGIVAIAPVDDQYSPAGRPTPIRNLSYLVIQGAHDADVSSFIGDRQYERVEVESDSSHFKASVYVYRANHGQFNTVWGNLDYGLPAGIWLNRKALMSGTDQRRIGAVYISAFLEAVLHGRTEYLPLFRDARTAARWLPEDLYVNRYRDGSFRPIADFEEDVDVTTGSLSGARIAATNLAIWREQDHGFRQDWGKRGNQVAVIGWRWKRDSLRTEIPDSLVIAGGSPDSTAGAVPAVRDSAKAPSYAVRLPDHFALQPGRDGSAALCFSLAHLDEKPSEEEEPEDAGINVDSTGGTADSAAVDRESERGVEEKTEAKREEDEEEGRDTTPEPLDFSIVLVDETGREASLALSSLRTLLPPLRSRFTRWSLLERKYERDTEPVLQTFRAPLSVFAMAHPEFDPASLTEIRFEFDRSPEGTVMLDEMGVCR